VRKRKAKKKRAVARSVRSCACFSVVAQYAAGSYVVSLSRASFAKEAAKVKKRKAKKKRAAMSARLCAYLSDVVPYEGASCAASL
jgi:hypothetical protein